MADTEMTELHQFQAKKGINAKKLNENFSFVAKQANDNETALDVIAKTALLKDGSNLSQDIINEFNRDVDPIYLSDLGEIILTDNQTYFLTLTGNANIVLPTIYNDSVSHTIVLVVQGSDYSLDLGTEKYLNAPGELKTEQTYQVLYIYNKLDKSWYYCLGQ